MRETLSTVLVVDDSSFMRTLIAEMVESTREFQVVGTAADGLEAIDAIRSLNPDIVTLDIEMPRLDGLQTLDTIMRELPRPVVMLSAAGSERGNEMTLRALERGAVEFVRKPSGPISIDLLTVRQELLAALKAARAVNMAGVRTPPQGVPVGAEIAPARPAGRAVATEQGGINGHPLALAPAARDVAANGHDPAGELLHPGAAPGPGRKFNAPGMDHRK